MMVHLSPGPTPMSAEEPVIRASVPRIPFGRVLAVGSSSRVPASRGMYRGLPPVLALLLLVACTDSTAGPEIPEAVPQNTWAVIHLVSGTDQAGPEGSFLEDPVVVRVTDGESRPLVGVPLRFSVIHGGGLLHGDWVPQRTVDAVSDAQGYAQVRWRLGTLPEHLLKVSISPEVDGVEPPFRGPPKYVFASMAVPMSLEWTQGLQCRVGNESIPHDNRILETPHFLVFSDASSDDAKIILAAMAEESLHEILELFGIPGTQDLGIDQGDAATKITIYSDKTLQEEGRAYAFQFGFFSWGPDSGIANSARLRHTVKHEMTHVFRLLWSASEGTSQIWWVEPWMEEGLAEHVAGGCWDPIRSEEDMNEWRAQDDHLNPISIHGWNFFPASVIERSNGYEYYAMFDLAASDTSWMRMGSERTTRSFWPCFSRWS